MTCEEDRNIRDYRSRRKWHEGAERWEQNSGPHITLSHLRYQGDDCSFIIVTWQNFVLSVCTGRTDYSRFIVDQFRVL